MVPSSIGRIYYSIAYMISRLVFYTLLFRYPNLYCQESLEMLDLFLAAESQEVRGLCSVLPVNDIPYEKGKPMD